MEKYIAKQIVTKIMNRDYERWIKWVDEQNGGKLTFEQSFFCWKAQNGMMQNDIDAIADILGE